MTAATVVRGVTAAAVAATAAVARGVTAAAAVTVARAAKAAATPGGEGPRGDRPERGPAPRATDDDGPAPEFAPAFLTRDDDLKDSGGDVRPPAETRKAPQRCGAFF